jgi:hypothetical protein
VSNIQYADFSHNVLVTYSTPFFEFTKTKGVLCSSLHDVYALRTSLLHDVYALFTSLYARMCACVHVVCTAGHSPNSLSEPKKTRPLFYYDHDAVQPEGAFGIATFHHNGHT